MMQQPPTDFGPGTEEDNEETCTVMICTSSQCHTFKTNDDIDKIQNTIGMKFGEPKAYISLKDTQGKIVIIPVSKIQSIVIK